MTKMQENAEKMSEKYIFPRLWSDDLLELGLSHDWDKDCLYSTTADDKLA